MPFEQVWGLLVDESLEPGLPPAEPYAAKDLTGDAPADLQAVTAALGGEWRLGKLIDITDARGDRGPAAPLGDDDLRRRPVGPRGGRSRRAGRPRDDRPRHVHGRAVPARVARRGRPEARRRDRDVLDLHRRARPERLDVHRARRRLDRRRLRRVALLGGRRALGPAARRRAGARAADARRRRRGGRRGGVGQGRARPARADHGLRPPHLPRRGSARAAAAPDGEGARRAALRGRRGARAGGARRAARAAARPRARDERRVLVGGRARRRRHPAALAPAMFALLADGRLVGAHPRAEAARPARSSRRPSTSAQARARSASSSAGAAHARSRLLSRPLSHPGGHDLSDQPLARRDARRGRGAARRVRADVEDARGPRVGRGLVDDADGGRRPDRAHRRRAARLDGDAPERRRRRGDRPLVLPARGRAQPRRLRGGELPVGALPLAGAARPRGRRSSATTRRSSTRSTSAPSSSRSATSSSRRQRSRTSSRSCGARTRSAPS